MSTLSNLATRGQLPEDLQVLVKEFPREVWAGQTGPFTAFYLERHDLFRRLTARMQDDAEAFLDGRAEGRTFAAALARFGGLFLSELHGHHQIEDQYYFPRLMPLDTRVAPAFDLLEADHIAIDGVLDTFRGNAQRVLDQITGEDPKSTVGTFLDGLSATERLLDRHLADEEDIVVPLMLKYGEDSVEH